MLENIVRDFFLKLCSEFARGQLWFSRSVHLQRRLILHFPEPLACTLLFLSRRLGIQYLHLYCLPQLIFILHANNSNFQIPDDVVVYGAFASQVKRVMRSFHFPNFQVEWLIGECHSFAISSSSEVARFVACWNIVLVIKSHGNVPILWKRRKWSLHAFKKLFYFRKLLKSAQLHLHQHQHQAPEA